MLLQNFSANSLQTNLSADPFVKRLINFSKNAAPPPASVTDAKFDWRTLNKVTRVKNQGWSCGSCYIFAALAAYESAYLIANNSDDPNSIEVSEQELLDCGFAESNCVTGGWHEYIFVYLQTLGAVASKTYPYNSDSPQRGVYCNANWNTRPYYLQNWGYVSGFAMMPSVQSLKTAVIEKGPVACGVNAVTLNNNGDNAAYAWENYTGGVLNSVPSKGDGTDVNHEVVIVGWDDTLQGSGVLPGVWIVKNSWGSWPCVAGQQCSLPLKDQGYVYIPYGRNSIGFGASWVAAWSTTALSSITEELKSRELQRAK
jgi:C1A family cysteine protease